METARTRKELTHERIVETAARAIRRGGFHGVGVADIMKEAGLTHGGFYAHFPSRNALLAEALEHAGKATSEAVARRAASRKDNTSAFRSLVDGYLSEAHLQSCETGCPVAALASEMPRQAPEVREVAAQRVRSLLAKVQATLPAGTPAGTAGLVASQLVGSLQLARTLGDNAEGKRLLATTRRQLLAQFDRPNSS